MGEQKVFAVDYLAPAWVREKMKDIMRNSIFTAIFVFLLLGLQGNAQNGISHPSSPSQTMARQLLHDAAKTNHKVRKKPSQLGPTIFIIGTISVLGISWMAAVIATRSEDRKRKNKF